MAKRRGRPKVEDPRTITLGIRVTPEEQKIIDDICERTGKSRHDLLIDGIISGTTNQIINNNVGVQLEISNDKNEINIKIKK